MRDNAIKNVNDSELGIRHARRIVRASSESFTECGEFSHIEEKKVYKPGEGIVHTIIETVVYFDCLHKATPDSLGGTCCLGRVVCRSCIIRCAEPGCTNMICAVRGCRCGGRKNGQLYCWRHGGVGFIEYLSLMLRG